MTKLDERSVVPRVDEAARKRLAKAIDQPGIVSALLCGSQGRGNPGPLSDIDVAVWLDPGIPRSEHHTWKLRLMSTAWEPLRTSEVEVSILNQTPPQIAYRAIRDGVRLIERDPRARVRLETRAILDYLDTAPLRAALAAGLKHRVEEGRFGRR